MDKIPDRILTKMWNAPNDYFSKPFVRVFYFPDGEVDICGFGIPPDAFRSMTAVIKSQLQGRTVEEILIEDISQVYPNGLCHLCG